jgi:indoleamine 2,3-dioxygenase
MKFYGGSAAQSSLIPFLDIALGVSHESSKSQEFLLAMREYMPKSHREFLGYVKQVACIRQFIIDGMKHNGIEIGKDPTLLTALNGEIPTLENFAVPPAAAPLSANKLIWISLRDSYDRCIEYLKTFRNTHITLVTEYIMSQQKKLLPDRKKSGIERSAGGKGTGGTDLMSFLKPIRDNCGESLLSAPLPKSEEQLTEQVPYVKDNADLGDIDVYGTWGPLERERYGW